MNEALKKEALELIPEGLNVEILNISGVVYNYYGHNYSEGGEMHENSCICVTIKDELIKEPLHIHFFNGANYRKTDQEIIIAYNSNLVRKNSIAHPDDSFSSDDVFSLDDEAENIRYAEIIKAIDLHCSGDEENEGALSEDPLLNRAEHIHGLKNIVVYTVISLDNPNEEEIIELESKLNEAKEAFRIANNIPAEDNQATGTNTEKLTFKIGVHEEKRAFIQIEASSAKEAELIAFKLLEKDGISENADVVHRDYGTTGEA